MHETYSLPRIKKLFKKTLYSPDVPLSVIREAYEKLFYCAHIPNNVDVHEITTGTIPVDVLQPEFEAVNRVILYAHGGSFICGSRKASRSLCASIAHVCHAKLFLPEYRVAPEYPYPAALDDFYCVYKMIIEEYKVPTSSIILAGDGAGANIVTVLISYLKEQNMPLPAGLVLISPWLDLSCSNEALDTMKRKDRFLAKGPLLEAAKRYTSTEKLTDPLVSPLYGSFEGFPPVFMQCGGHEILLVDAKECVAKIEAAGGSVTLDIWENMYHLFQALDTAPEKSQDAIEKIGVWVQNLIGLDR